MSSGVAAQVVVDVDPLGHGGEARAHQSRVGVLSRPDYNAAVEECDAGSNDAQARQSPHWDAAWSRLLISMSSWALLGRYVARLQREAPGCVGPRCQEMPLTGMRGVMNDCADSAGEKSSGHSAEEEVRSALGAYVEALGKTPHRDLNHRLQLLLGRQEACTSEDNLREAESRARCVATQSERHRELVLLVALDETVPASIRSRLLDLFETNTSSS